MPGSIFLDSQPAGLLATPLRPNNPQVVLDIREWVVTCLENVHKIYLPEIVDYEVRRELLRSGKTVSVAELDRLRTGLTFVPLTTAAMLKAAELWAEVRQQGLPTASNENIDVDVILAAQALTCGIPIGDIVVATVNPRHLTRFITADLWQNIAAA